MSESSQTRGARSDEEYGRPLVLKRDHTSGSFVPTIRVLVHPRLHITLAGSMISCRKLFREGMGRGVCWRSSNRILPPELTTGGIVRRHVDAARRRLVNEHLITDNTVLIRRPCRSNIAAISQQHCASP